MTETGTEDGPRTAQPHVIVVGGGLAGMCAAIAAAEKGASVTVLDRAYGGGASAISAGVVYAGGGTRQQVGAGFGDDTADDMFRYLRQEVGEDAADGPTLRRFCDGSAALMAWLEAHGAGFGAGPVCPFRTSYPPPRYPLFFSGNERAHPFAGLARPAPRGHRPAGEGEGGMGMSGGDLWRAVFAAALRLGVRFEPASRAEGLLVDGRGRVAGVRYRAVDRRHAAGWVAGGTYRWLTRGALACQATVQHLARLLDRLADAVWERSATERTLGSGAVILAAGGFIMNRPMVEHFAPWARRTATLGTAGDDGSGIRLGQSVGGSVSHMDRITAWRLIYPPEALTEGIIVSAGGERIAAEDLYGGSFTDAMVDRSDGRGFLILDSVQWDKARGQIKDQTHLLWRIFIRYLVLWAHRRAGSLGELARKLGVDPAGMEATVEAYNSAIADEKPDPVGKLSHRSVIATGPFYGIDVSLRESGFLMVPALTLGGLRVDGASGMVLDEAGGKIEGLYAAGRNALGICSGSYVSGLSLADCVFSGRRAGDHAAGA